MEKNRSLSAEELLRKILDLEALHALIKQELYRKTHPLAIGAMKLTETQYLNILQSTGQAIFIHDIKHRIIFWNQGAEYVYGYTAGEVIGRTPTELLTEAKDASTSEFIIERTVNGESWFGEFPVTNKKGESFVVICANTPFCDESGRLVGAMSVACDSRPFVVTQQPLQTSVASKTSDLYISPSPFGVFSSTDMTEDGHLSRNRLIIQSAGDRIASFDTPANLNCENSSNKMKALESRLYTLHVNSTNSMDHEISWEDLIIKQQIGQGSCGTVYRGLWHGSDVAVKVFAYQEFSDDLIVSFRQEVSLMKRLRHPNILLFMGAVTSPQHLSIVTEFLPRGNLFRVLQRTTSRLDWKRRIQMAIDIAQGMNYLHHCNPPIIHRDLKSSNLLVDKNWTVKVGDFGLSRIKHQVYLKTKSRKGTPQWMAPEVIRSQQADEKSDVYSYGVVLWEIITGKIPWDGLNSMQVIAEVGFVNRRLEIPKDADPQWASLIHCCWFSEPQSRPTFQEILYKLKDLKRMLAVECRK